MIRFVQTGEYRTRSVRIKRFTNGVESTGDGFPIIESMLSSFGTEPAIIDVYLDSMNAVEYNSRVDAFKLYLIAKYSFLNSGSFSNTASGQDVSICVPGTITGSGTIQIDQETEIIIFFDSSGSMNTALAPLLQMRNTLLKAALLPFYNGNSTLYDEKVRIISDPSERTFHLLNNRNVAIVKPTLIMVFQDESNPSYHSASSISPRTATFDSDITALRNTIPLLPAKSYKGLIFQVTRNASEGVQFKNLIKAVEEGTEPYTAGFNLSDRTEIGYQYDVPNNQNSQYYMDLILLKMRALGYRI
jgi:hypothetical protein